MKHAGLKRAAPKGTDWWRCPDCLAEGPLKKLMGEPCTATVTQSQERTLTQAMTGTGKFAPDGEA